MKLIVLLLVTFCVISATAAKKPPAVVSKEDLKYIRCDVCERMISALTDNIESLKASSPKGVLDELQVIDVIENICNPFNTTGEWIRKLDITDTISKGFHFLKLTEPGGTSTCGNECVTIARSCEAMLEDELEIDDLATMYRKKTKFSLRDYQVGLPFGHPHTL